MALDKATQQILFSPTSKGQESNIFIIDPGQVVVLRAYGFDCFKASSPGQLKVPQVACLMSLLLEDEPAELLSGGCGVHLLDITKSRIKVLETENMRINGCGVTMSKDNNTLLLDIPGVYQFFMDDPYAVGNVRIYYNAYGRDAFPRTYQFLAGA